MKAPPKRKGNSRRNRLPTLLRTRLNESPSEKEGKCACRYRAAEPRQASMKAPPKRKGNAGSATAHTPSQHRLNESPSEKEGKLR